MRSITRRRVSILTKKLKWRVLSNGRKETAMELLGFFGVGFMGQACCWYTIFNWCGCIDGHVEREEIQTQRPQSQTQPQQPLNPFVVTGMTKDPHLLPAYG